MSFGHWASDAPERLFAAVARGENVIAAAVRMEFSLPEVLACLYEREGDYMAALRKAPRRMLVTSNNPAHWPK